MIGTDIVEILAIVIGGTLIGNEIAVGAFIHPNLTRLDDHTHLRASQAFARTFGGIMPFWYASTLILTIAVLFVAQAGTSLTWWLTFSSIILFAITIIYTLTGLVQINNRVSNWDPESPPTNWREDRQKWDRNHLIRTLILFVAFLLLVLSIVV
jgi:hypothetical protein